MINEIKKFIKENWNDEEYTNTYNLTLERVDFYTCIDGNNYDSLEGIIEFYENKYINDNETCNINDYIKAELLNFNRCHYSMCLCYDDLNKSLSIRQINYNDDYEYINYSYLLKDLGSINIIINDGTIYNMIDEFINKCKNTYKLDKSFILNSKAFKGINYSEI